MSALLTPLLAALALGASAPSAPVERLDRYPTLGFAFERSSRLEARQVPPDAEGLLLLFAPQDAPRDQVAPVTQRVYRIEDAGLDHAALRAWTQRRFPAAELAEERAVRERYGRSPLRLEGAHATEEGERGLFVHAWVGPADAVVFVGECEARAFRRERRGFERAAGSFRFFEQADTDAARRRWEARYRRSRLPFEEQRIEVGLGLAEGWTVTDTQDAMVLFHGSERSSLPDQLADGMEAVRRRLRKDLPPDAPIESLAVVRICRDRGEYLTYGGSPSTVGYFNPGVGELVLYDARTDADGPLPVGHPTMRTLFHETCHQYLHQVTSAAAPHTWFGEGLSEYYSGCRPRAGRVEAVDSLEDSLATLRRPEVRAALPPLSVLLTCSQETFYAQAALCYPYSYALVRFLLTSEEARGRPAWSGMVDRYFLGLREAWRAEVERLALRGITRSEYARSMGRAQAEALEAALEGVDLPELEQALNAWIQRGRG